MNTPQQSQKQQSKAIDAESRAAYWLAEGNEASERGQRRKAERFYAKSQFWLDRYNKLVGRL